MRLTLVLRNGAPLPHEIDQTVDNPRQRVFAPIDRLVAESDRLDRSQDRTLRSGPHRGVECEALADRLDVVSEHVDEDCRMDVADG